MQIELDRIKEQVKEQTKLMFNMDTVGANWWESLNQELKSLKEDVASEVEVNFKDMENVLGRMQHRINKLEAKVENLSKSWPKESKPRENFDED